MKKLIIPLVAALLTAAACSDRTADTVVYGTIRTAEEDNPLVEAIAVKDGKYIYAGDKAGAAKYIKEGFTNVIDHTGKGMVTPSFTDGHAHYLMPLALANMKGGVIFGHEDDKATVMAKVEAAALAAIENKQNSLLGFGWNYNIIMPDQPTLAEIDAATHGLSTVLIDATGHNLFCNSECLRRCGILSDTGEVLINEIDGGLLQLDANGYPTGYLNERATGYVQRMGGIDPDEVIDEELAETALLSSQELLLSTGYTSYMEGWSNCFHPGIFYEVASRLDNEGKLKIMLPMTYEVEPWQKDMDSQIDYLASLNEKYSTAHVRPEYLKVFMDGCVEQKSGAMSRPYKDGSTYRSFWSVDRLAEITRECNSRGLTVHTHVMGDDAITEATDAYIKGGDGVHRNCLVHIRHPRKEDFQRFAENNIACTAGMTWHVASDATVALMESFMDEQYARHAYPVKSFFDAGVKVTSHSDFPANETCPQDPFGIMEIAISGQMLLSSGEMSPVFDAEELVTLDQVFQALTINGAWQLGMENERGSIKVGKWADFVLADQDVFDCPVTDIHKTRVVSTWFEGEEVYKSE